MTESGSWAYRAGVGVALATAFLIVWATIVRDDGSGAGSFMIILAVPVGWFVAGSEAARMARAMVGVAIMQVLLGALAATAPVVARTADGSLKAVLFNGAFAALWLISAALFRRASRRRSQAAGAH